MKLKDNVMTILIRHEYDIIHKNYRDNYLNDMAKEIIDLVRDNEKEKPV